MVPVPHVNVPPEERPVAPEILAVPAPVKVNCAWAGVPVKEILLQLIVPVEMVNCEFAEAVAEPTMEMFPQVSVPEPTASNELTAVVVALMVIEP